MDVTVDTRKRIVDTAQDLFHTWGYTGVAVREICERAGVQKGSFYHYFDSKHDLLMEVIARHEAECIRRYEAATGPAAVDRVRALFRQTYELLAEEKALTGHVRGCPLATLTADLAAVDEAARIRLAAACDRLASAAEMAVVRGFSAESPAVGQERMLAQALVAYHQGVWAIASCRNDPSLMVALMEGAVGLLETDWLSSSSH